MSLSPLLTRLRPLLLGLPVLGALLLAACNVLPAPQADSTRFYVLTGPALATSSSGTVAGKLRIGFKNVQLAEYLKTPTPAVRSGANELTFPDATRWAEPLEAGIGRVLEATLQAAPTVGVVYARPFPFEAERDYDVSVIVTRCEGSTGSHAAAHFAATVEISTAGPTAHLVAHRVFAPDPAPWDGHDYGRLVALLSAQIGELGQTIVSELPESPRHHEETR